MPKTVKQVIAILEAGGWTQVRQRGSHRQFRHPDNPHVITVVGKPTRVLQAGLLGTIRRSTGLEELR